MEQDSNYTFRSQPHALHNKTQSVSGFLGLRIVPHIHIPCSYPSYMYWNCTVEPLLTDTSLIRTPL